MATIERVNDTASIKDSATLVKKIGEYANGLVKSANLADNIINSSLNLVLSQVEIDYIKKLLSDKDRNLVTILVNAQGLTSEQKEALKGRGRKFLQSVVNPLKKNLLSVAEVNACKTYEDLAALIKRKKEEGVKEVDNKVLEGVEPDVAGTPNDLHTLDENLLSQIEKDLLSLESKTSLNSSEQAVLNYLKNLLKKS